MVRKLVFLAGIFLTLSVSLVAQAVTTTTITALKEQVIKTKPCVFAIGQTDRGISQMTPSERKSWPMNVWIMCVHDTDSGCEMSYYNVETQEYSDFDKKAAEPLRIQGQKCQATMLGYRQGAFDELLKLKKGISTPYDRFARFDYNPTKGYVPVSAWLTDYAGVGGPMGRVLLYSAEQSWTDWWQKERAEVEKYWDGKLAEQEKKRQAEEFTEAVRRKNELLSGACNNFGAKCRSKKTSCRSAIGKTVDGDFELQVVEKPVVSKDPDVMIVAIKDLPLVCKGCVSGVGGGLKCPPGYPKLVQP